CTSVRLNCVPHSSISIVRSTKPKEVVTIATKQPRNRRRERSGTAVEGVLGMAGIVGVRLGGEKQRARGGAPNRVPSCCKEAGYAASWRRSGEQEFLREGKFEGQGPYAPLRSRLLQAIADELHGRARVRSSELVDRVVPQIARR